MKLLLAVILMLCLAACGTSQPGLPGQSASPSPSASGSILPSGSIDPSAHGSPSASSVPPPAPSTSPSAAPDADIRIDTIAIVVTNDLRVRSKPRVAADSALRTPLLNKGRAVFIVDGPVEASGFTWYEIAPMRASGEFVELPFGWAAAAGKDGEPWLAGHGFKCPGAPTDVHSFLTVPALVGLACFGKKDLAISGRLARPEATCGVDIGWTIEPEWLASTCPQPMFYVVASDSTDASFDAVLNPGIKVGDLDPGVEPADWLNVRVTGHFDHPAARKCHGVSTEPGTAVQLTAPEIVLACRATFVITDLAPSG